MMKRADSNIRSVQGPVFPIPTPFTEAGEVDYTGLQNYLEFLLDKGVSQFMVTVGTSRFDLLAPSEMYLVNRTVAEVVGDRGVVIVTTPSWGPTKQAIDFALQAEEAGADGILLVFPERYYSDDQVFEFFGDVSRGCPNIDLLIHLSPLKAGKGGLGQKVQYSLDLLERIFALENMVGMKEESLDPGLSYNYNRSLQDKCLIIGGAGGMRDFFIKNQWGQKAYLVGIGNINPHIELDYYQKIKDNNLDKAKRVIYDFEEPFFNLAVKVGWHIALKEAMAYRGLIGAAERKPLKRLDRDQKNLLAQLMDTLKL